MKFYPKNKTNQWNTQRLFDYKIEPTRTTVQSGYNGYPIAFGQQSFQPQIINSINNNNQTLYRNTGPIQTSKIPVVQSVTYNPQAPQYQQYR